MTELQQTQTPGASASSGPTQASSLVARQLAILKVLGSSRYYLTVAELRRGLNSLGFYESKTTVSKDIVKMLDNGMLDNWLSQQEIINARRNAVAELWNRYGAELTQHAVSILVGRLGFHASLGEVKKDIYLLRQQGRFGNLNGALRGRHAELPAFVSQEFTRRAK